MNKAGKLPGLSLLIKPASSLCSMRCRYCFYADEAAHRDQREHGLMSRETALQLIGGAFEAVKPGGTVTFAFQGGEPTLAGLDFFRDFCAAADELNTGHMRVQYSIQTNGLLIDGEWADFFRQRGFLAGVSVDGYEALHDAYRVDAAGNGTFERVSAAVKLLKEHGVDINLLCVVSRRTAEQPRRVYRALRELGSGWVQLIPCLDPLGEIPGGMEWSLQPEAWGRFLCGVFDLWYRDLQSGHYVSIRQFEDWARMAAGLPPDTCAACGACGGYLVAESDGSLYPCDFYALDEWRLGTADRSLTEALASGRMDAFRLRSMRKPAACGGCSWRLMCRGGCPRDWETTEDGCVNRFCPAYRMLFDYAGERLLELARTLRYNSGR